MGNDRNTEFFSRVLDLIGLPQEFNKITNKLVDDQKNVLVESPTPKPTIKPTTKPTFKGSTAAPHPTRFYYGKC